MLVFKQWIKIILVNIILILLVLIGAEQILKAIGYNYRPMDIEIKNINDNNDFRNYHIYQDEYVVYDKDLLWVPDKDTDLVNEQGFIGKSVDQSKDNRYIIFAIGDSNTAGGMDGDSWPKDLDIMFQGSNVDVINAGVWGYTSYQGLIRFKKIIDYKPNMVLISFGANDAHQVQIPDKNWAPDPNFPNESKPNPLWNLKLITFLQEYVDKIKILFNKNNKLGPRVSLSDYRSNLVEMVNLSRENNIQPVLLTRPFIYKDLDEKNNPDPNWWKTYGPLYNEETRSVAKEFGIPLIDVYAKFEDKNYLFQDEVHFTKEGDGMMAKFVYDSIKDLIH